MAVIVDIVGIICKIIAGAVSQQLTNEFKEWTCWVIERLVQRAVQRLPKDERDRFGEEWRSHIDEVPGQIGKIVVALNFTRAARKISAMAKAGYRDALPGDNLKRAVDVVASAAFLVAVAPELGLIATILRLTGHGSALVCETRVGLCGRRFEMLRFRIASPYELRGAGSGTHEHREPLTRLGGFLRKTGLYFLPVAINVFRGDMSLIGPLPHPVNIAGQMSQCVPRYDERTKVRPGLVSLATLRSSWEPLSELADDIYYVRNRSLKLDFTIFCQAVRDIWMRREE
ncbi:MAG TPA: sugar transferase [Terriglobia bacterium]|nr:sugar transferase [Terriglobia bacterium]